MISKFLENRQKSPKQCRERWYNYIDPSIDAAWSEDDILTLLVHVSIFGTKWTQISNMMSGFSAAAVKNMYIKLRRSLSRDCADPTETLLRYYYLLRQ